ncbi:MAG: DNA gyrase subunit A [Rickettsiales bacterium]|nr:DNA gyrase subunit A [Rickettsiales bacterium]OUV79023.1 MAG: DNA gyrase subunit A [Rickettsiales bacterium TMED131]
MSDNNKDLLNKNGNGNSSIQRVEIEDEMKKSYLDYAMSVIVSRALPDIRDGLKPVHRRILYSMYDGNYDWNKPYKKSARIVGEVMGKYHPHGDSAIYESMVRMAQSFSMSLKLLDGQGNFGSMDGDPPAAMRYTEIRLGKVATTLLEDIDKDTVNFVENYDNSLKEPSVLPAKYPNLLVNGAGGIAVGMATNIPPHNLGEIIDATILLLNEPNVEDSKIKQCILGPDFPTGGIIIGSSGIESSYSTGRGSIIIRGSTEIETNAKDKASIIVNEIPYQVNKSRLVEQIADCVRAKKIEGITDLRDESDKDGVRVVIELKRDATPEVVLNQLHKFTSLQTSFGTNILALKNGLPTQFGIRVILETFIDYRIEVIIKRTTFDLSKAREKEHILIGLAIAIENIDKIIEIIRGSKDTVEAKSNLISKKWESKNLVALLKQNKDERLIKKIDGLMYLSEEQAKAILELRLQRLTGLERNKVESDLLEVSKKISHLLKILSSDKLIREIIINELVDIKSNYAVDRRTKIFENYEEKNIDDLIEKEDVVLTLTNSGYVKTVPVDFYRSQKRGGKGRSGMTTKEDDFVEKVLTVNSHDIVLFFTNKGIVHQIKVYKLPKGSPQAKGRPLINVIPLSENELTTAMLILPNKESNKTLIFVTKFGNVRRNKVSDFINIKANGKRAMKLDNNDKLKQVLLVGDDKDIILSTSKGKCVRFNSDDVRVFSGRTSMGVRGIKLQSNDRIISASILNSIDINTDEREEYLKYSSSIRRKEKRDTTIEKNRLTLIKDKEQYLLSVTENGFGKRSSSYEYRKTRRGGQGILNIETSERNGGVVASFPVKNEDEIMLVTNKGKLIRLPVNGIRIAGRVTQGVTLLNTEKSERVVSVTKVKKNIE